MKSGSKKTFKLVAATSMSLFSLLTVFSACVAWFSLNKEVNNDGPVMNVEMFDRRFGSMTFHKYIGTSNGKYQFYKEPSGTLTYSYETDQTVYTPTVTPGEGEEDLSSYMGEYSLTSPRHPFLAIIEYTKPYVTSAGNEISISASTDNPFICSTDENDEFILGLDENSNPLSSVIKFSSNSYASLTSYQGSASVESTDVDTYDFTIPNSWDHFVQINTDADGNYTFDNETGWSSNKNIITVNNGSTVKYISIIFDYYDEALGYIYNKYLGSPVLEQDSVPFTCDWRLIV